MVGIAPVTSSHHSRQIAASTLWQLGSQAAMAALSIVTVKFVAMGLGKELAGNYNTAYGYLQFFGILADFGLYAVAVREVAKAATPERRASVLGALITLRAVILGCSMLVALAFVWIVPTWRGTPLPPSVTIAAFVPVFTLLAGILRTVFQVEHRMGFVFVAEVSQRIITVTLTGLFILWGVRQTSDVRVLYAFLAIGAAGAAELFALSLVFARRLIVIRPSWDIALLRRLLGQAAPYGCAFLCTALYRQFDVTLIARLRLDYELQNAYYGFVQRMMDMAYLLPTFLLNSALPLLAQRHREGADSRRFLGGTFLAILLLSTASLLFALIWARPLTQLLTTEQYLSSPGVPGSDTALSLLSLSMFLNGFVLFSFYALLTAHRWRPLVATLTLGVAVSLAMNLWLIPPLGFVGAAITSIVTHAFLALALLPQALRAMPMTLSARQAGQWAAFAVLLAIPLLLLRPYLDSSLETAAALAGMGGWVGIALYVTGLHRTSLRYAT